MRSPFPCCPVVREWMVVKENPDRKKKTAYVNGTRSIYKIETAVRRCSGKQMFLITCKIHRNTPVLASLFKQSSRLPACNFVKKQIPALWTLWNRPNPGQAGVLIKKCKVGTS